MRNSTPVVLTPKDAQNRAFWCLYLALLLLTVALALAALCIGRYPLEVIDVIRVVASRFVSVEPTWNPTIESVIFLVRVPRIIAAVLAGGALAASGSAFQSTFRNPLAAPELLGVFQGASVGAALAILFNYPNLVIQLFALTGGILAVVLTSGITKFFKSDSTAILVLAGVIVSGLLRSVLGMLKYVMDTETQLPSITYWELGSLAGMTMRKIYLIAPTMIVALVILLIMLWQLNLLSLGDNEARSLGVNVLFIRGLTVICATFLTSCAVCLAGTIAWIGLVIPHAGRALVGPDNIKLTPIVIFIGAIFLIVVDTIARSVTGLEIPLSILTGLIGAPIFIGLLLKQRMQIK